jgi:hypothetical protein
VVASLLLYLSTLAGAKALHSKTLLCLMHCPMAFFDTTPQGRIMNRFSKGRPPSPYLSSSLFFRIRIEDE